MMRPALRSILVSTAAATLSPLCALTQVVKLPPPPPAGYVPPAPHKNAPQSEIPRMPGDGDGAYKTNHYRDLFAEAGHTSAETSAKIEKAFQQLFHGDGQYERLYFETGANQNGPLAYITDWANNDARTEGMSYGMMIAVQLNHKREFDALWNWANTYMLVTDPNNPTVGYFAWSMTTDGSPRSTGPAPDGEEYFVMGLYFAAHRWGNGKGIYNYQAEADKILRGMRHHSVLTATGPFRIHPDDPPFLPPTHPWHQPQQRRPSRKQSPIDSRGRPAPPPAQPRTERAYPSRPPSHHRRRHDRRTPHHDPLRPRRRRHHEGVTDASYHLPAFYELWARWGPQEDRDFWAKAADVSRQFLVTVTGPETALTPERSNFDMSPVLDHDGNPTPSVTTPGAPSATGPSTTPGGTKTHAKPSSATASRNSSSARASTPSSIATPSTANRSPSATPPACSPPPPSAASPPPPAPPKKPSSKTSGTLRLPPASSATTTACSTS